MCVHTCVRCAYVCACLCVGVHMCMCVLRVHAHMCVHCVVHVCVVCALCACVCLCVGVHTCMCVRACMLCVRAHTCVCALCTCVCLHARRCACACRGSPEALRCPSSPAASCSAGRAQQALRRQVQAALRQGAPVRLDPRRESLPEPTGGSQLQMLFLPRVCRVIM